MIFSFQFSAHFQVCKFHIFLLLNSAFGGEKIALGTFSRGEPVVTLSRLPRWDFRRANLFPEVGWATQNVGAEPGSQGLLISDQPWHLQHGELPRFTSYGKVGQVILVDRSLTRHAAWERVLCRELKNRHCTSFRMSLGRECFRACVCVCACTYTNLVSQSKKKKTCNWETEQIFSRNLLTRSSEHDLHSISCCACGVVSELRARKPTTHHLTCAVEYHWVSHYSPGILLLTGCLGTHFFPALCYIPFTPQNSHQSVIFHADIYKKTFHRIKRGLKVTTIVLITCRCYHGEYE